MNEKIRLKFIQAKPNEANSFQISALFTLFVCLCVYEVYICKLSYPHTLTHFVWEKANEFLLRLIETSTQFNPHMVDAEGWWGATSLAWFLKTWKGHSSNYACDIWLFLSLVQIIFSLDRTTEPLWTRICRDTSSGFLLQSIYSIYCFIMMKNSIDHHWFWHKFIKWNIFHFAKYAHKYI